MVHELSLLKQNERQTRLSLFLFVLLLCHEVKRVVFEAHQIGQRAVFLLAASVRRGRRDK